MHSLKLKISIDGIKSRVQSTKERIGNSAENLTRDAVKEGDCEREVKSHE